MRFKFCCGLNGAHPVILMTINDLSDIEVPVIECLSCIELSARALVLEPICGILAAPSLSWLVIHPATCEVFFF